jgi:hypothetical protein
VPGPGVDEAPGQRAQADRVQVHEGEGDVADNVDAAQPRVELDRIEGKHLALPAHQIAQMQIAMALAHKALRTALIDQRLGLREGLVDRAPHGCQFVQGATPRPQGMCGDFVQALQRPLARVLGRQAARRLRGHRRQRAVKGGQVTGQRLHVPRL